jgi:hypothetical protein
MALAEFVEFLFEALHLVTPGTVEPFPTAYALTLDTTNASLNLCQNSVAAAGPTVTDLCGAVADLTGAPASPPYSGHNDSDMLYVGSLAKVYAMYVAFELKARVQKQAKQMIVAGLSTTTAGWENKVYDELKKSWQPKLNAAFPSLPSGMPQFATIFVLSATGDATFTEQSPPLTDADIDAIGEFGQPRGKYRDWMRSMMRWSNNLSASNCIRPLSYPYINGVLGAAGFFDAASKKGLWLSGDYEGHDWVTGPGNRGGQSLAPRFATAQARTKSNFTGTALQVARLVTLLGQSNLVDATACTDMLVVMTGSQGIGSYIRSGLAGAPRSISALNSKIGFGDDSFSHDCALISVDRGTDTSRKLRFVEVILGSPPAMGRAGLKQLAVAYYDCITAQHP